jgi:hypothetical protein
VCDTVVVELLNSFADLEYALKCFFLCHLVIFAEVEGIPE